MAAGAPDEVTTEGELYGRYLKDLLVRGSKGGGNGRKQAAE
jgi:hypothetical protein